MSETPEQVFMAIWDTYVAPTAAEGSNEWLDRWSAALDAAPDDQKYRAPTYIQLGDRGLWPDNVNAAIILRASGDPWTDLNNWKRIRKLAADNDLPFYPLGDLVFPSPEEQRAALGKSPPTA